MSLDDASKDDHQSWCFSSSLAVSEFQWDTSLWWTVDNKHVREEPSREAESRPRQACLCHPTAEDRRSTSTSAVLRQQLSQPTSAPWTVHGWKLGQGLLEHTPSNITSRQSPGQSLILQMHERNFYWILSKGRVISSNLKLHITHCFIDSLTDLFAVSSSNN